MVAAGTTLLEAARQLGVGIEAICGGHETCNKCLVQVEVGEFPKHNLRSAAEHLSQPGERERQYRQKRNLPPGSRFSCSARVLGDVLVTVPEESQAHKQVVLKAASGRIIDVDPIIRLYYLELESPQVGEAADQSRALAELVRRFGLSGVEFDYPALPELSDALRQAGGAITLTVWNDRLITRVQAGYHEQPLGLAVDIGSTTLAAYLCDLRTGQLLATASAMNPQVTYGDDIMSRISYANEQASGRERLHRAIIRVLNQLAQTAAEQVELTPQEIVDMTIVGNSVMHHLFLNLNPKSLGQSPFIPVVQEPLDLRAADLGLRLHPGARLHVLPLEAGFVGFYHAVRLGEGRDTPFKRERRIATIQVLKDVGLHWMNCVEPLGPEHDPAEIVDLMFLARRYGAVYSGAMRRINFPGSPMEKYGMVTELELARVVAVSRLVMGDVPRAHCTHEPHSTSLLAGANLLFPEVGSSPRDQKADSSHGIGRGIDECAGMLREMGWNPGMRSNCFGH